MKKDRPQASRVAARIERQRGKMASLDERIRPEEEESAMKRDRKRRLVELAKEPNANVRRCAAANPTNPAASLVELAKEPNANVRRCAAANPTTPAASLVELAKDPDANVRWGAAANPSTPAASLVELAKDPNANVRRGAAANPSTTAATLVELAKDPDANVRWGAANNPSTPTTSLVELAKDPNAGVRQCAAGNPADRTFTGAELLERLGFPTGFTVFVRVPGGGDWSNTDLEISDETPVQVRRIIKVAVKTQSCPERNGPHVYTADLEYDATGRTVNCELCGEAP